MPARIRKGDRVIALSGKDKGKSGIVMEVRPKEQRVLVEGLNIMKRHTKPRPPNEPGGVIERPAPIQGGELDTSLLLYLAPHLVRMDLAQDFDVTPGVLARYRPGQSRRLPQGSPGSVGYPSLASAQKGELLYTFILERVSRCLVRS